MDRDKELEWTQGLYKIGQMIAHEKVGTIQQKLLEHIVSFFDADSGSIALLNDERDALTIVAGSDSAADFINTTIPASDGIIGWVVGNKQSLLLAGEVSADPRFKNLQPRKQASRPGSALCWPLMVENKIIGTLSVNRGSRRPRFDKEELRKGDIISSLASPVISNVKLYQEQQRHTQELEASNKKLREAQSQLLQSEKMASIGHLAAGVAHEINNPVGYISSNLNSLDRYVSDLIRLLDAYESVDGVISDRGKAGAIQQIKKEIDIEHLKQDIGDLVRENREGISRVKEIIQNLKEFSHVDEAEWQWASLHKCLDSTLNIVSHELKYKADVVKEYGDLPLVECLASQLNQVFMNLLVNAAQAIEGRGVITIRTGTDGVDVVWVDVRDTGKGMPPEIVKLIFDPFFTTKPVGQGTGLGLSLSYSIIQKHGGRIEVDSEVGKGTTFRIRLPVRQQEPKAAR